MATEKEIYQLSPEEIDRLQEIVDNGGVYNKLQSKEADPSIAVQIIEADQDERYDGLSQVVINAVDSTIDSNISAENIKKDVTILGVTGTYSPSLQSNITIEPTVTTQNFRPSSYAGYETVTVNAVNPADYIKPEDAVALTPSTASYTSYPAPGRVFSQVTVEAVTSNVDLNIQAENIKKDVTILGVTGSYEPALQIKNVNPAVESITVTADSNYYGLSEVTVNAVTSNIDLNIKASNIKSGTTILGVTGTYESPLMSSSYTPKSTASTIYPATGYLGFSQVTINAAPLQSSSVTPAAYSKTIVPTGSYIGFSRVIVNAALTSYSTIYPSEYTQTVTAPYGYVGFSYVTVRSVSTMTSTIYPQVAVSYQSADTIYPSTGYFFSCVTVNRVTSSIDPNIQASNIKKDVSILGVTGTLEGSGGVIEVDTLPEQGNSDSIYRLISNFDLMELDTTLPDGLFNFTAVGVYYQTSGQPTQAPPLQKVYLIGGEYLDGTLSDKIYIYDISSKTLVESLVTLPFGVAEACGIFSEYYDETTWSNKYSIYLFGGKIYESQHNEFLQNYQYIQINLDSTTFDILNITADSCPWGYCGAYAVGPSNYIYLIGGQSYNSNMYSEYIWQFNCLTNSFSQTSCYTGNIKNVKCVGQLSYNYWLFAGVPTTNLTPTNLIYTFSLNYDGGSYSNPSWTRLTPVEPTVGEPTLKPQALYNIGGCALTYSNTPSPLDQQRILGYAVGGTDINNNKVDTICGFKYGYNSSTGMQETTSELVGNLPIALSNAQCVDTLIFGGLTNDGVSNKIYVINTDTKTTDYVYRDNQWYNLDELGIINVDTLPASGRNDRIYDVIESGFETLTNKLPLALCNPQCVSLGDYIYIIGGLVFEHSSTPNYPTYSYKIYKYNTNTAQFTELNVYWQDSYLCYSCFVLNNNIYIVDEMGGYRILDTALETLSEKSPLPAPSSGPISGIRKITQNSKNIYIICMGSNVLEYAVNDNNELYCTNRSCNLYQRIESEFYGMVATEDYVYILPYANYSGMSSTPTNNIYKLSITNDFKANSSSWDYTYPKDGILPYKLDLANIALYGNNIYIFGGKVENISSGGAVTYSYTDKILRYNLDKDSVEELSYHLLEACAGATPVVHDNKIYIFGGVVADDSLDNRTSIDTISLLSFTVAGEYVYRDNNWININSGGSGGVQVDKVTNLSANGTVISWVAPDITAIAQYNPQLAYAISVDGAIVTTTTQTSIDISQYLGSGTNTVAVTVVLTYTDIKNETITISGKPALIEVSISQSLDDGRVYWTNGILGICTDVYRSYDSFPVYYIFGGNDNNQYSGVLTSSIYSVNIESTYIAPVEAPMSMPTYYNTPKLVNVGGEILAITVNDAFNIITPQQYGWSVQFSQLSAGYLNVQNPAAAYVNYEIEDSSIHEFVRNIYIFGGLSQSYPDIAPVSTVYSLAYSNWTWGSLTSVAQPMPDARFMAEAMTSRFGAARNPGPDDLKCYIVGGITSFYDGPSGMSFSFASTIHKFMPIAGSFDPTFSNIIPSNIQIPALPENYRMVNQQINVQGTDYILGKDIIDNKLKLFEFDYEQENLKSSGFELANQEIKALDTAHTTNYINYGLLLYAAEETGPGGSYQVLKNDLIFKNGFQKTVLLNSISDQLYAVHYGFAFIKNNHMYIMGEFRDYSGSYVKRTFDINLETNAAEEIYISGYNNDYDANMSMVDDGEYAYLVGDYIIKIDFENRSATTLGDMPYAKNATVVLYNNCIYSFGGALSNGSSYEGSNTAYKYDLSIMPLHAEKLSSNLTYGRYNAIGVISNGACYIYGGYSDDRYDYSKVSTVEKFDFNSDTFDMTFNNNHVACDLIAKNGQSINNTNCCTNPVFSFNNKIYFKALPSYYGIQEFMYFNPEYENIHNLVNSEADYAQARKYINQNAILEWDGEMYCICYTNNAIYALKNDYSTATNRIKVIKYQI